MKYPAIGYSDYLQIEKILSAQQTRSDLFGVKAHDELLFIITHQTYELWFKQVLFEVDSVLELFAGEHVDESSMGIAVSRIERINEIIKVLTQQITILETMTPLDFLDFRDMLFPASGFQSVQFRLLENKLGLKPTSRLSFNKMPYTSMLKQDERNQILQAEQQPSLFELVDRWLARTPFLESQNFAFWKVYQDAAKRMFEDDIHTIQQHPLLQEEQKIQNINEIKRHQETFNALFDVDRHEELKKSGTWRLSFKAIQAALFIQLYRDQPILHMPFRVIVGLQNMDELLTTWRYRHALMAQRMLGSKIGTGGSSGHQYLKDATERHRIFNDLFQLTTFFIPRSKLPALPRAVQSQLDFSHQRKT